MPIFGKKRTKADTRREMQRRELFPTVQDDDVWETSLHGWCWMPRTMPIILQAIRALSKGTSAGETYLALWCHSVSHGVVEMKDRANLIASAGYQGPSNERTWRERMRKLEELGFIKIAPGKHGEISSVLLMNPHKALRTLHEKGEAGLEAKLYNTMVEQMSDYGMKDFEVKVSTEQKTDPNPESKAIARVDTKKP